jgi:hypothetical protein
MSLLEDSISKAYEESDLEKITFDPFTTWLDSQYYMLEQEQPNNSLLPDINSEPVRKQVQEIVDEGSQFRLYITICIRDCFTSLPKLD